MDTNEKLPETSVPRFLDDVQMVERKRLRVDSLSKQRWSLSERRPDSQNMADMGVALLEDSPTETSASADTKENLENRSPNLRSPHSLKRQYSISSPVAKNNSPCLWKKSDITSNKQEITDSKHDDVKDAAKINRISNYFDKETVYCSKNLNNTNKKHNSDKKISNSESFNNLNKNLLQGGEGPSNSAVMSINTDPNRKSDESDQVDDSDESLGELDCSGQSFDGVSRVWRSADRKRRLADDSTGDDGWKKTKKSEDSAETSTSDILTSSQLSLQSDMSLTTVSPRPTCLAHPALHNRPPFTSIPRHTTFDDDVPNKDEFGANKPSASSNEDRITLEQIESMNQKSSDDSKNESETTNKSQLTLVDRVIFDSANIDFDQTVAVDEYDEKFYFKPEDTVLQTTENVADSKKPDNSNLKCVNTGQNSVENTKESCENNSEFNIVTKPEKDSNCSETVCDGIVSDNFDSKDVVSKSNIHVNPVTKKDSNKKRIVEKQSSLKSYFVVESEKKVKNATPLVGKDNLNVVLPTGNSKNSDLNSELVTSKQVSIDLCESTHEENELINDNFKINVIDTESNIDHNYTCTVSDDVLASPLLETGRNLTINEDNCHLTPSKSNASLLSTCEACGDKEKYCDSHSKNSSNTGGVDGGLFAKLSDEMVLSILQWLPKRTIVRCMLVSRRWRRLGADSRLWARVDLGGRVLPSGALAALMTRHPVVVRLANAQLTSPAIPPPFLQMVQIREFKWRIQFLDLSAASVSPSCLAGILYASPGLIRLSLEGLTLGSEAAKALLCLTKIKSLNLALTTDIGPAILYKYSQSNSGRLWPQCESLNIAWSSLEGKELEVIIRELPPTMRRLNVSGCRKFMTDDMVCEIVTRCPNLLELDLSDSAMLSNNCVSHIVKLASLEHLAISRCYRLVLQGYVDLGTCPSLQWLDVFGIIPNLTLSMLQKCLPNMHLNKYMHSSIARPTVGTRRTSIWGLRTRD